LLDPFGQPCGHTADVADERAVPERDHRPYTTVHRGRITKQGSTLVRRAAIEAVQRIGAHTRLGRIRDRIAERRGRPR
jgi:hypothetical protein